jgi:hypothetical protein
MKEHQLEYYRAVWKLVWTVITLVWMGWVTWRLLHG